MSLIGRNDPCPCGSGLKYKKCCLLDPLKEERLAWAMKHYKTEAEVQTAVNREPLIHRYLIGLDSMRGQPVRGKIQRTIEIDDNASLYDLHMAIQSAFGWDNDHLFSFFMSNMIYDKQSEYSCSPLGEHDRVMNGDTGKSAADTRLYQLGLAVGQQFMYLFDYGDDLVHTVQLAAIAPRSAEVAYPRLVKSAGKAPDQYG